MSCRLHHARSPSASARSTSSLQTAVTSGSPQQTAKATAAPQRTWPNRTCASGRVASFRATTHPGRELDHKRCQTPLCVNSEHLEEVTHRRNVLRGDSPAATRHRNQRCGRGHPMTAEHGRRATNGRWYCNTCRREQRQTSAVAVPPPGFYDLVQVRAWARQAVSPRLLLVSRAKRYPLWRVVPTGQ